jgi:hypothetical protein
MKLLTIYTLLDSKEITDEEAALALGLTDSEWRQRRARWGARLPLLFGVLDRIRDDTITRDEAADVLQTSVRNVNALMKSWHVARPLKEYLIQREAAKVKFEIRKKAAIDFIAGADDIETAAVAGDCSTRQIRRWVSDLLGKHFNMVWKDLKGLRPHRRERLAREIERMENLEVAKQAALDQIRRGSKSVHEEAIERILSLSKRPT